MQRIRVHQQADDALDVVGIDVRDHQQVEMARAGGQVQDALAQGGVGVGGADRDQREGHKHAMRQQPSADAA